MVHSTSYDVTFGDCDPAGIVFYPNIYRWMDRCFHDWMRSYGGHSAVCKNLGGVGLGLRNASAEFLRPIRDGDTLNLHIAALEWSAKSLTLFYEGAVNDATVFKGQEARALFVPTSTGMKAGELQQLRELVEQNDERQQG